MKMISIYRNGVWAGQGTIDHGGHVTCAAVLGNSQDDCEECYSLIEEAIADGDDAIERPDGRYSWDITD